MKGNGNLWGGRFEGHMADETAAYNESLSFDHILYPGSIAASKAHAAMLAKCGIITKEDGETICKGLDEVKKRLDRGEVKFSAMDEDIMMTIERELTSLTGDAGRRLHTARSRNDQNAVDEALYLREQTDVTIELLRGLLAAIVEKAKAQRDVIMPGFTHLQHAQPITVGFYYMAHFQGIARDLERFTESRRRLNLNPLGAGALAGTTLPIDREYTTRELGFDHPTENALDTVGSRDTFAEYLFNAALCMTHLSGFAEEIIVFNSQEFSFITLDDSFCTGSSIMPQKRNPDIAELVRGKSARAIGNLMRLLTMLKGTFLTLNKDYQEDKEALFDSVHTLQTTISVFTHMLEKLTFRPEVLAAQLKKGFLEATDIAEYLVGKGMPFRTAHERVGELVKLCEKSGKTFADVTPDMLQATNLSGWGFDDLKAFTPENGVKLRRSFGGTAPEEVARQIADAEALLKSYENA